MSWQIAVLKILSAAKNGEADVETISADLKILTSVKDSWSDRIRYSVPRHAGRNIFSDGLITRPSKGRWRISPAGRDYLRALEYPVAQTSRRLTRGQMHAQ